MKISFTFVISGTAAKSREEKRNEKLNHNQRKQYDWNNPGEEVPLKTPVVLSEEVETWLKQLVDETRNTLQQLLTDCLKRSPDDLADLSHYPSQVLCLAEAVMFSSKFTILFFLEIEISRVSTFFSTWISFFLKYELFEILDNFWIIDLVFYMGFLVPLMIAVFGLNCLKWLYLNWEQNRKITLIELYF